MPPSPSIDRPDVLDGPLAILVVTPDLPFPPSTGHKTRVLNLARQLACRHRVVITGYANGQSRDEIDTLRGTIDVVPVAAAPRNVLRRRLVQAASLLARTPFSVRTTCGRELQPAVTRLLAERRFDCVVLESSTLGGLRFPAGLPIVVDQHNIEWELLDRMREGERSPLRRWFSHREAERLRHFEETLWGRIAACAVTSPREVAAVAPFMPAEALGVVPNAVDVTAFRPDGSPVEQVSAVFTGTLHYRPNVDAVLYLVDEIWPLVRARRPDARLQIVGSAPAQLRRRLDGPGVQTTGEVEDVRPHIAKAAVAVVPVRIGGGTRFKVLEGLAMGKPMVSTSLGCEGIDVEDGRHLLVADSAQAFADAVVRLFDDPALAASFASAARELLEQKYGWEAAGAEMARLVDHAVRRPVNPGRGRLATPP